jgi:glutathione S-transferase
MALTFYHGAGSPFSWRVHLALEYKGIDYTLRTLSFDAKDTRKPEFVAMNPRHRVPTIDDDGFILWEAAAILEYLDERFAGTPALFPSDMRQRATARRLVHEIESDLMVKARPLAQQIFAKAESEWDQDLIRTTVADLKEEVSYWENQLRGDFFLGEFSAVDITFYPWAGFIPRFERKKPDLGLSKVLGPKLVAWKQRMEGLPFFDKTYPPHWRQAA